MQLREYIFENKIFVERQYWFRSSFIFELAKHLQCETARVKAISLLVIHLILIAEVFHTH